jgi:hypothetical protein
MISVDTEAQWPWNEPNTICKGPSKKKYTVETAKRSVSNIYCLCIITASLYFINTLAIHKRAVPPYFIQPPCFTQPPLLQENNSIYK